MGRRFTSQRKLQCLPKIVHSRSRFVFRWLLIFFETHLPFVFHLHGRDFSCLHRQKPANDSLQLIAECYDKPPDYLQPSTLIFTKTNFIIESSQRLCREEKICYTWQCDYRLMPIKKFKHRCHRVLFVFLLQRALEEASFFSIIRSLVTSKSFRASSISIFYGETWPQIGRGEGRIVREIILLATFNCF